MRNIIAGTAGHIDHGKTALVRALTGIETDRLEEEKRRGISIELGFAHLQLSPDLRIGFVDVPGHERFIRNMLAGVAGIDVLLFVIAADESIKPQTREHFDICRLLGVPRGIVVLTKIDLVDAEILELVRLEVDEFVRGSFLEHAPVIAVSSTTGAGLDALRDEIRKAAEQVRSKDSNQHFRLPVDRAFSMKGFGTVVTGTLIAGSVSLEQEIDIHPAAKHARVRGIQVHGEHVNKALAGQRTALNLAGIDADDLARGMVLTAPACFHATQTIDTLFDLLPSAKPLKHRAPVHFHAGTAEIEAEVRLLDKAATLAPGARAFVRIVLKKPALLLPGDRFIARMFSPVVTIGGGRVIDIDPPRVKDSTPRLTTLSEGTPQERVSLVVREARYGLSLEQVIARTGLLAREIGTQPWLLDPEWTAQAQQRITQVVAEFHKQNPLLPGMSKEELRSREFPDSPAFLLDTLLAGTKAVVAEGENLRLATHRLALKQDEEQALAKIEAAFQEAGLAVPSTPEALARSGVELARARNLLQMLLKNRRLVRISEDLVLHRSALEALRALLASHKGERFTVAEFKDWTGVSRKYAIPLLEFFDRERVTRREGDTRLIV